MRLRYVLLATTGLGALASLLLAWDFYQRLKDAERFLLLNRQSPGPDSILNFGPAYALGLFALAFLFLSILLMLVNTTRDKEWVARLEQQKPPTSESIIAVPQPEPKAIPPQPEPAPITTVGPPPTPLVVMPAPPSTPPVGDPPSTPQADPPPATPTADAEPSNPN